MVECLRIDVVDGWQFAHACRVIGDSLEATASVSRGFKEDRLEVDPGDVHDQRTKDEEERFRGFVDRVDKMTIIGWACDMRDLNRTISVEALASNGKCLIAIANLDRNDLKEAGIGNGRHGFSINIAGLGLKSGSIIVRFYDTKDPITTTPIELDAQHAIITNVMPEGYAAAMRQLGVEVNQKHLELTESERVNDENEPSDKGERRSSASDRLFGRSNR